MSILRYRERLSNEFRGGDGDTELCVVSFGHFQRLEVDVNVHQLRERKYNSEYWGDV